jgi:hypothetical protein
MSKGDEVFIKDLNNTSTPQEARQLIVNQLIPECREVGNNFFQCVEKRLETLDPKLTKYEDVERKIEESFLPECMKSFNLEECLNKYTKK